MPISIKPIMSLRRWISFNSKKKSGRKVETRGKMITERERERDRPTE